MNKKIAFRARGFKFGAKGNKIHKVETVWVSLNYDRSVEVMN